MRHLYPVHATQQELQIYLAAMGGICADIEQLCEASRAICMPARWYQVIGCPSGQYAKAVQGLFATMLQLCETAEAICMPFKDAERADYTQ